MDRDKGLANKLISFFQQENCKKVGEKIVPNCLKDFIDSNLSDEKNPIYLKHVCNKLESFSLIVRTGDTPGVPPILSSRYMAFHYSKDLGEYGCYDFMANGFPSIVFAFSNSVKMLNVSTEGRITNGTCFKFTDQGLFTAAHCVSNINSEISFDGIDLKKNEICYIGRHKDESIDIAFVQFKSEILPEAPFFKLEDDDRPLTKVLVMGYPPLPCFDKVMLPQTMEFSSYIKTTTGESSTLATSYINNQTFLLLNAKVKGGSSGSPVISESGRVLGIITDLPENSQKDDFGFSLAIPAKTISSYLNEIGGKDIQHIEYEYEVLNNNSVKILGIKQ